MNRKILYSALFDGSYPFGDMFEEVTTVMNPEDIVNENAALIIWGGGDISPSLYGHGVSTHTGASETPSNRDLLEVDLANKAVSLGIPVIGICRGAQIMCALSGGYLIQDCTGHTSSHLIEDVKSKDTVVTSSLHHQMMFPWNVEHKMIAVSSPKLSRCYMTHPKDTDIITKEIEAEPEIVWFPKTKSLAIQGHPEFLSYTAALTQYCRDLINRYVYD